MNLKNRHKKLTLKILHYTQLPEKEKGLVYRAGLFYLSIN
jgi:hypothetical protein